MRQQEGSTLLYASDQVQQTGKNELKKADSTIAVKANNDNRSESDLSFFSGVGLVFFFSGNTTILQAGKASLKNTVSEINIGLQLWKLCIILALIFLAAEIVLVRYYKPVKQQVKSKISEMDTTHIKQRK